MEDSAQFEMLPTGNQSLESHLEQMGILVANDRIQIINHSQRLVLSRKVTLFNQNDKVEKFYIVISGVVKLTKQFQDRQAVLDLVVGGNLIAVPLMESCSTYPVTATVISKSVLLELSKEFYHEFWKHRAELMNLSLQQMMKKTESWQIEKALQRDSLEKRVAYFLTERVSGIPDIKITRQDIADAVGATNESIVRLMKRWENLGILRTSHQKIEILKPVELREKWLN